MDKFFKNHWCVVRVAAVLAGRDRNGSVAGTESVPQDARRIDNAETPREKRGWTLC